MKAAAALPPLVTYLLGPEVYWALVCLAVKLLARRNLPPTDAGSQFLEKIAWLLPLVLVPLTFAAFWMPGAGRWWLLARIDLAAAVGLFFATTIVLGAIDYRDSRNSGVGSAYIALLSLGVFFGAIATVVAAIVLGLRNRGAT